MLQRPRHKRMSLPMSKDPFQVRVSARFLVATLLGASVVAFAVGRFAATRTNLDRNAQLDPYGVSLVEKGTPFQGLHADDSVSSHVVLAVVDDDDDDEEDENSENEGEDHQEEQHNHRQVQFLFDFRSVNKGFVRSKERLLTAVFELVKLLDIGPVLSHHCHESTTISCFTALEDQGHVSFYAWPYGVLSLDIFVPLEGSCNLMDVLSLTERLFGVPEEREVAREIVEDPQVVWSVKKRHFRFTYGPNPHLVGNPEAMDMDGDLLESRYELDLKQMVTEQKTAYQKVDIASLIFPKLRPSLAAYKKSLLNDASYYSKHPEVFKPDKAIYLDGVVQSRLFGEAAYHEALVHPAMVAHPNPKRVVIVGGGEGATLREVLKHNTVERVTMIEIDKEMVDICREHLPEWNTCSNLVGSTESCFDDPRAEIFFEDAVAWFIEHFGDRDCIDPSQRYDVLIMDALDPDSMTAFSDMLYANEEFALSLTASLNENGVLIAQDGEAEEEEEVGDHLNKKIGDMTFINHLKECGFESVENYEEDHGGLDESWSFVIAFKDLETRKGWSVSQAEIDLKLQQRAIEMRDGTQTPFRYFDGATMMAYQFPTRPDEACSCRTIPAPQFCFVGNGFDPKCIHASSNAFEVKKSENAAVPRIFARESIPKGSYLAIDDIVGDLIIPATTLRLIQEFHNSTFACMWESLNSYMLEHGHSTGYSGELSVDTGVIAMLLNHSGRSDFITENAEAIKYNVMFRRNVRTWEKAILAAVDIKAGEELSDKTWVSVL